LYNKFTLHEDPLLNGELSNIKTILMYQKIAAVWIKMVFTKWEGCQLKSRVRC
jgi:hypothetical protein